MVAYSFKRRFVEPIRSGSKKQTIRADRKRHARIGETLQLYTGMRTKQCMLIGTATCSAVMPITLDFSQPGVMTNNTWVIVKRSELNEFARSDGFRNWRELHEFWESEHDAIMRWSGVLIRWDHFRRPETGK